MQATSRCGFSLRHICIYTFPYIYIFVNIIITIVGLSSTTRLVVFPRVGLRSGAYIFESSVTRLRGFPCRILPSLGAEPPSPLVFRRCSAAFSSLLSSSSSLRGSPPLSQRRRTTQPSLWIFHGLSRSIRFRFTTASSSCVAARGHRVTSRRFPLLPHRRRARKSHAGAFAPPAPLRVTGICKSIYL